MQLRIAMWSGPRNISTALMRAWGNRDDTIVCDEPLYAHYLRQTGRLHPGREQTLAAHEADWRKVVDWLTGGSGMRENSAGLCDDSQVSRLPLSAGGGKAIFYQKHMAHHLLPNIGREWLDRLANCFLIRDPREMLVSLLKHVPDAQLEDTGLPQQLEIYRYVCSRTGRAPPVVDARDVLENPRGMLEALCAALGVAFSERMLSWPPGLRETDGAWAPFWYREVEQTATFAPYRARDAELPPQLADVHARCLAIYDELYAARLVA